MNTDRNRLVYEIAVSLFTREMTKKKCDVSPRVIERMSAWSIENAREFVAIAEQKGLLQSRPGLFDMLNEVKNDYP